MFPTHPLSLTIPALAAVSRGVWGNWRKRDQAYEGLNTSEKRIGVLAGG